MKPSRLATLAIDTALSPSASARAMAASTIMSTVRPGLGPRWPLPLTPHRTSSPGGRSGVLLSPRSPGEDGILLTITVCGAYSNVYAIHS